MSDESPSDEEQNQWSEEAAIAEQASDSNVVADAEVGDTAVNSEATEAEAAQGNDGGVDVAGQPGFDELANEVRPEPADDSDINMDVILDVPITLAMEVGRTRMNIRNLLQLNQGSVVELDRAAGEPLDVFVNGTLIAHGEVVVINERFGIRLTDVISPAERVRKLK